MKSQVSEEALDFQYNIIKNVLRYKEQFIKENGYYSSEVHTLLLKKVAIDNAIRKLRRKDEGN